MSAILRNISVNARYDLQKSGVQIFYETSSNINGQQSLSLANTDIYPNPLPTDPNSQFKLLQFTVDLQGISASLTTVKIVSDQILASDPNWWLARHPQFTVNDPSNPADAGNEVASISLNLDSLQRTANPATNSNGTPIADKNYAYELSTAGGSLTSFTPDQGQRIKLKILADVTMRNGTIHANTPLTYECVATNTRSGTYTSQQITALAEPVPVGLAQQIYDAISVLQFDGSLVLQEEDCSGSLLIGQLFNIMGSANSEWNTMAAQVHSIEEDIDTGQTTIRFGPNKFLTAGELVDLLRINRSRLSLSGYTMRASGSPSNSSGQVDLGQSVPEKNSVSGIVPPNPHVISSTPDGTGPIIQHQSTGIDAVSTWSAPKQPAGASAMGSVTISVLDAEDRDLKIQPLPICMNGVSGTIYLLCSEFEPDE